MLLFEVDFTLTAESLVTLVAVLARLLVVTTTICFVEGEFSRDGDEDFPIAPSL